MFSCIVRFLLLVLVCFAVAHAYPPSMSKPRWIPARVRRPNLVQDEQTYDYLNSVNENDSDSNDSNGFATWLFRSRKFCCAPPL